MFRSKNFTAVDVGMGEIKIAVLSCRRRKVICNLLHRYMSPGMEHLEGDGTDELAAALKAAFKSAPGAGRKVITAIGGQRVITRQLRLPAMPLNELEQAVVWQAEKLVPLPVDDLVIRPVVLGESQNGESGLFHVLLVAVRKELVYRYYDAFDRAGLQITAIDLQHLALWRVFHGPFGYPVHDGGVRAVLDLGFSSGQFVVLKGQELVYVRSLPVELGRLLPAGVFEPAPAEPVRPPGGMDISGGEAAAAAAEEISGEYAGYDEAQFEHLGELVREIRRSLDFYQLQERDNPVETLVVTGGFSKIKGLPAYLAGQLGIRVAAGFPRLPFRDVKNPPRVLDPAFSVAVGLALREVLQ
ncbi:MAG: type IV pilus assembly protein PilM [Thermoanaerobacteraceae bacterium]|nr:type IV pilus assembly protein PilM [Thermoanaerobacteraceae bacterium]